MSHGCPRGSDPVLEAWKIPRESRMSSTLYMTKEAGFWCSESHQQSGCTHQEAMEGRQTHKFFRQTSSSYLRNCRKVLSTRRKGLPQLILQEISLQTYLPGGVFLCFPPHLFPSVPVIDSLKAFYFILLLFLWWGEWAFAMAHMWRSEDNFQDVFFFYCVGPGGQTCVISLDPLTHLTSTPFIF